MLSLLVPKPIFSAPQQHCTTAYAHYRFPPGLVFTSVYLVSLIFPVLSTGAGYLFL